MSILEMLGKRIRYLRKSSGRSIEDLALEAEVNKNYLSDLERGKRNPSLLVLNRISTALGITLEELFKGI